MSVEHFRPGPRKRGRGRARASVELIAAAAEIVEQAAPISVRGICYRLFVTGFIPSMERGQTAKVSRLLTIAREEGTIPWEGIVDETRELERVASWSDPADFIRTVRGLYRRDFWKEQPRTVEVWSEKGTVRGVLAPVLHDYGVGFQVMHGFGSATAIHNVAQASDLVVLYVGDWDPSGLYMSERDLPDRLWRYGSGGVALRRVALLEGDTADLPSFPASAKGEDTRYRWFVERYGSRCWELDAMHPADLRARVEESIIAEIEPEAWRRCADAQEAEQESLASLLDRWTA